MVNITQEIRQIVDDASRRNVERAIAEGTLTREESETILASTKTLNDANARFPRVAGESAADNFDRHNAWVKAERAAGRILPAIPARVTQIRRNDAGEWVPC